MKWEGVEVHNLLAVNGLRWPIAVSGADMQIGCENHPISRWAEFTDKEIKRMSPFALDFWREYKTLIMGVAYAKAEFEDRKE